MTIRKRRGRKRPPPRPTAEHHPRRKRTVLWIALVVVLGAGSWGVQRYISPTVPPITPLGAGDGLNILLVTVDTTRADYLGCYGRAGGRTPNIDRLAREGAMFTRCTTCSPFTLPSHSSILTSLYPYVHGARRNGTDRLTESNLTLPEALKLEGYAAQATVASFVLNRKFGTAQGFDVYHDVIVKGTDDELHAEYKADRICDNALVMLRSLAGKKFFLWTHFYDPHFPYESPRVQQNESSEAYEDEIAFMDGYIGRLLDELARLGLESRTLVVLVADHGEGLGEHQEKLHGLFLYESSLNVPLIVRLPGTIRAGQEIDVPVRTIDIAPTVLEMVGAPAWDHAQGVSLADLLTGNEHDLALTAYAESFNGHDLFGMSPLRSLSVGDWKYILAPKPELYLLDDGSEETRNRLADQPDLGAEIRERLRTLIAEAPPPPEDEGEVMLEASEIAKLEALGYVTSTSATMDSTELSRFEPKGGNPKDFALQFEQKARGSGAMRDGEYDKAEQYFRELIAVLPEVSSLQVDLAKSLYKQERLTEADAAFQLAVTKAPDDPQVRKVYGNFLLYGSQDFDGALKQLTVALRQLPNDIDSLHDASVALTTLGRFGESDSHLQRALRLEPGIPRLWQAMGVLRMKQGKVSDAVECFRKTLELDPECREARAALQWIHRNTKS